MRCILWDRAAWIRILGSVEYWASISSLMSCKRYKLVVEMRDLEWTSRARTLLMLKGLKMESGVLHLKYILVKLYMCWGIIFHLYTWCECVLPMLKLSYYVDVLRNTVEPVCWKSLGVMQCGICGQKIAGWSVWERWSTYDEWCNVGYVTKIAGWSVVNIWRLINVEYVILIQKGGQYEAGG